MKLLIHQQIQKYIIDPRPQTETHKIKLTKNIYLGATAGSVVNLATQPKNVKKLLWQIKTIHIMVQPTYKQ